MLKRTVLLILVFAVVAGCAPMYSSIDLTEVNSPKLNAIYMNKKIPQGKIYYFGPGVPPKDGDIELTKTKAIERIRTLSSDNNIHIDEIVKQAVLKEMLASGRQMVNSPKDALSTLHLTIAYHGFSIPHGFSSKFVPMMFVKAELVDQSGSTIWLNQKSLCPLENPAKPVPALEILTSAENIRRSWTVGAEAIASQLINTMHTIKE